MIRFFCGLDLGQVRDYTAFAVLERIARDPKPLFHLRYLQRFPLRTSYLEMVARIKAMLLRPELYQQAMLGVDGTGVGVAVMDLLREARLPCPLYAVTIHGGDVVTEEGRHYRVPKRDLIGVTQVALQSERLRIAPGLPEAVTLTKELLDYRVTIGANAHDSYDAREGAHDDLVLAVSLGLWLGERHGGNKVAYESVTRREERFSSRGAY